MDGPIIIYKHRGNWALTLFGILAGFIIVYLLFIVSKGVFIALGLSPAVAAMITVFSFLGGFVNIPIYSIKTGRGVPVVEIEYVEFMGMVYPVPRLRFREDRIIIAINVGGCIIPLFVSMYMLGKLAQINPIFLLNAIIVILMTALIVHSVARPVPRLGIVVPSMIPPLTSAILSALIAANKPYVLLAVAYAAGALGSLIGADLMNLNKIKRLGSSVASIGGAGTFDGIYLSGIMAVILASLLSY